MNLQTNRDRKAREELRRAAGEADGDADAGGVLMSRSGSLGGDFATTEEGNGVKLVVVMYGGES